MDPTPTPVLLKVLAVVGRKAQVHLLVDVIEAGRPSPISDVARLLPGGCTRFKLAPPAVLGGIDPIDYARAAILADDGAPFALAVAPQSVALLPSVVALDPSTVVCVDNDTLTLADLISRAGSHAWPLVRISHADLARALADADARKLLEAERREKAAKASAAYMETYVPAYLKTPLLLQLEPDTPAARPAMPPAAPGSVLDRALLRLSDESPLNAVAAPAPRVPCPTCARPGRYYCNTDLTPLLPPPGVPHVSLPARLIVVKHKSESLGMSTAAQALLVAPDTSAMVDFPSDALSERLAALLSDGPAAILYPSADAEDLGTMPLDHVAALRSVIVLDGTWHNVKPMLSHPALAALPRIALPKTGARTSFWRRNHKNDPHWLSTIEAIYVMYRTLFDRLNEGEEYDGRYDDLMWMFVHLQRVVGDAMVGRKRMHEVDENKGEDQAEASA